MWNWLRRKKLDDIAPAATPAELQKRVKIVVIDDEEDSFPTERLQEDGYTIDWWPKVDSHRLNRLERGDFDIIILDIQGIADASLSETGDGQGILRRIKAVNPSQVVVAFSGRSYDLGSVPFWRMADEALTKPVSVIACKEVLDRLIEERVNVRSYWKSIEAILRKERVSESAIRKLEVAVVKAGETGGTLRMEDLKKILGPLGSLDTVLSLSGRLLALWKILSV
jgi:DNA-binding response OmpR family regulator